MPDLNYLQRESFIKYNLCTNTKAIILYSLQVLFMFLLSGLGLEWLIEPPDKVELGKPFNVSYRPFITEEFYQKLAHFPNKQYDDTLWNIISQFSFYFTIFITTPG